MGEAEAALSNFLVSCSSCLYDGETKESENLDILLL
jgi:hypothetical protein